MADYGTLVAWHVVDGVGRIRLDGGDELRVGQTAFGFQKPSLGMRCHVLDVEPHPLGGLRAKQVKLLVDEPVVLVFPTSAPAAPKRTLTEWLLERIRASHQQPVASVEVRDLLECHQVFSGKKSVPQVFGIDPKQIDRARHQELLAAVEAALVAWRAHLSSPIDQYELDKAGRRLGLQFLRMQTPPRLRCEPLGTTDRLDKAWLRRITFLGEAVRG